MKIVSILTFCFILVSAKPYGGSDYQNLLERRVLLKEQRPIVPILRFISSSDNYGTYSYEHSSADGTSMQESGHLKNVDNELVSVKSGSYEWTSPEGERFHVDYTADELGFHPVMTRLGLERSPVFSAPLPVPAPIRQEFRFNSYEQPAVRFQAPLVQVPEPISFRVPSYSDSPKIFSRFPNARFPTSVRFDSPLPVPLPVVEEAPVPVSRVPLLPSFLPTSNINAKELINFAVPEKHAIHLQKSFVRLPSSSYGYASEPVPEPTTLPPPPPPPTTENQMYHHQPSTDAPVKPPTAPESPELPEKPEIDSTFPVLTNFDMKKSKIESKPRMSHMEMNKMNMNMRPRNEMKSPEPEGLAWGDFDTNEFSIRSSNPNNVLVRIGQH